MGHLLTQEETKAGGPQLLQRCKMNSQQKRAHFDLIAGQSCLRTVEAEHDDAEDLPVGGKA